MQPSLALICVNGNDDAAYSAMEGSARLGHSESSVTIWVVHVNASALVPQYAAVQNEKLEYSSSDEIAVRRVTACPET